MTKRPEQSLLWGWQDRSFRWLLVLVVALHLGVALGLYGLAARRSSYPIAPLAQWLRVPDARNYHAQGSKVMLVYTFPVQQAEWYRAWCSSGGLLGWYLAGKRDGWPPPPFPAERFSLIVGAIYLVLRPHPLTLPLLQSLACGLIGLLAYALAGMLGQPPTRRRWLALLVAAWPTLFVWAAVPLKETLVLLGILTALFGLLALAGGWLRGLWSRLGVVVALLSGVWFLSFVRFYLWWFVLGLGLVVLAVGIWSWRRGRSSAAALVWAGVGLALALGAGAPFRHEFSYRVEAYGVPEAPSGWVIGFTRFGPYQLYGSRPLGPLETVQDAERRFQKFRGRTTVTEAIPAKAQEPAWRRWLGRLLRAGAELFFFPYPWQHWPRTSSWTATNLAMSGYGLMLWFLAPGVGVGLWRRLRESPLAGAAVAAWGLALGLALGAVVLNLGTYFRLRDMAYLPLLLTFDPGPWRWAWARLRGRG